MARNRETKYRNVPPPLDESWWAAVLDDVEAQSKSMTKPSDYKSDAQNETLKEESPTRQDLSENIKTEDLSQGINWEWVKQLYEEDLVIDLKVIDHNRGGLLVSGESIQGFVPASHLIRLSKKSLTINREELLSSYIGQILRLKVIECEQERGRIVLSERAAQTKSGTRLELLKQLKEGDQIPGKVTTITNFGVFVDLGGVEGLIHISELSWGRVCHPNEIVSIGEELMVHILQIDHEKTRVALSIKRLNPNPWDSIHGCYTPGQVTNATITNIVSFGAFARLENGLDGLIHISEFSNQESGPTFENTLSEGQSVKVSILHIDSDRQRLGLSLYQGDDGVS